ncbi:Secondary metabolism regulator LAE1 [Penicillium rolfsii]|nr:Secondary metabolism regulator LAE1 [Penicillium rolfsii]
MIEDNEIAVDPYFYSMKGNDEPDDFRSETTSIASTIAKGRLENGRRYQATKEDNYWGPSDEQQFEAFEISHILFLVLDHYQPNPLFRAPIGDSPKHILDVGTGKGSWAIDVADLYPTATIRGVDLFPPPVTWMPPNCVFEVDDVLREWTWRDPFDFIHMRMMYGSFDPEGWTTVYKQAYDALVPGGWIEQVEMDVRVYSDDGTLKPDSVLAGWGDLFLRCSERAGHSLRTQETMRGAMEGVGFVDAHEDLQKVPIGPWAKDKILKEAGQLQYAHWSAGLEGWAMWLLTKYGDPKPWTPEEVQIYLAKVRAELKDPHVHRWGYIRRVWARKPTMDEMLAKGPAAVEPKIKSEPSP